VAGGPERRDGGDGHPSVTVDRRQPHASHERQLADQPGFSEQTNRRPGWAPA